jgi:hypothetical protein
MKAVVVVRILWQWHWMRKIYAHLHVAHEKIQDCFSVGWGMPLFRPTANMETLKQDEEIL